MTFLYAVPDWSFPQTLNEFL